MRAFTGLNFNSSLFVYCAVRMLFETPIKIASRNVLETLPFFDTWLDGKSLWRKANQKYSLNFSYPYVSQRFSILERGDVGAVNNRYIWQTNASLMVDICFVSIYGLYDVQAIWFPNLVSFFADKICIW